MDQVLLNLVLALATNELIHNVMEIRNIREKVHRLSAYMNKKPYKELPISIDTRAKSYGISFVAFVFLVSLFFGFYTWLDPSTNMALKLTAGILILSYALTAVTVDQYHVDIEKITKKFKK